MQTLKNHEQTNEALKGGGPLIALCKSVTTNGVENDEN